MGVCIGLHRHIGCILGYIETRNVYSVSRRLDVYKAHAQTCFESAGPLR